MKEKILALLIAAFSGARKDGLNQMARGLALQVSTEDEAKALVEKLTEAQVNDYIKEFRSEVDKEKTEATKTHEANLKKKFDLVEKKDPAPGAGGSDPDKGIDPNDIAALVKAVVSDAVKPFQTELAGYKASDVAKARLQSLNDKLTGCKDENFKAQVLKDFARMQFDTDEAFNEYLTEKETAITTANQNVANAALGGQTKPLFNAKDETTGVSKGVAEYVESQKPDNKAFSGKEV
jgi:hypothetical protein